MNRVTETSNCVNSIAKRRLSALAQLIAKYAQEGVTSTAELARLTQYSERAIRKAKAELECRPEPECRHQGAATRNQGAANPAPECRPAPTDSRARIDSPSGRLFTKKIDKIPPFPPTEFAARSEKDDKTGYAGPPFDKGTRLQQDDSFEAIQLINGNLILNSAERADWLQRFGGDSERLDLALIQAVGYVQANSSRPLLIQVRTQLARYAADKRDRDRRYAEAAKQNGKAGSNGQAGSSEVWRKLMAESLKKREPQSTETVQ